MGVFAITFDTTAFFDYLTPDRSEFWEALAATVYISVIAQVIGTMLGVFAALGGMSRFGAFRILSGLYVWFFRGTPIIVQIFFWFYGAPILLGIDLFPREADFGLFAIQGAAIAGIVALAVNEGAYMSEIVRAGIGAIGRGQTEAALSVGMRQGQAMRQIVLPQAARVIVPGLGNAFNNMLKTSSLLTFIGVYELFQDAQIAYALTYQPVEIFLAVALWYLLLTTIWSFIQVHIERHLGRSERSHDMDERWYTRWFGVGGERRTYA